MKYSVIKNQDGSYSFKKEDIIIAENLKVDKDRDGNPTYMWLPENSLGRKLLHTSKLQDVDEYELKTINKSGDSKKSSPKRTTIMDVLDEMTEEEREIVNPILERAGKRLDEKLEATRKEAERQKKIATLQEKLRKEKEELEKLMKEGN